MIAGSGKERLTSSFSQVRGVMGASIAYHPGEARAGPCRRCGRRDHAGQGASGRSSALISDALQLRTGSAARGQEPGNGFSNWKDVVGEPSVFRRDRV